MNQTQVDLATYLKTKNTIKVVLAATIALLIGLVLAALVNAGGE